MKAHIIFSFNPDKDEDVERIIRRLRAEDYLYALEKFDQEVLRPVVKYGCDDEKKEEIYQEIHDRFWVVMSNYGIEF